MSEIPFDLRGAIAAALKKIDILAETFAELYPHDNTEHNIYQPRHLPNHPIGANIGWETGFLPGMYWLAFELTGCDRYRRAGEAHITRFADRLAKRQDIDHHDLGFLYSLACVAPWRLTGNEVARKTALAAADHLMTRFWERPGIVQAWGKMDDPAQKGRTIVDSIMNMPLLYWASQQTGDQRYYRYAVRHAQQVQRYLVRADGSTIHTFYFDTETGEPRFGKTHQGAADDSIWAQGQGYAIYGYGLSYAYTGDPAFLDVTRRMIDCFVSRLPADHVAYWDLWYGDGSGEHRDSSASAVAVCGMLEYARRSQVDGAYYRAKALAALGSLYEHYSTRDDPASNALLLHAVYNHNSGRGVDEGNLWGDYFYLEALTRIALPNWQTYW